MSHQTVYDARFDRELNARETLKALHIPEGQDFHALTNAQVFNLLADRALARAMDHATTARYVSTDDSVAAGNCKPATDQFASEVWRQIGASGPCAVRADIVLAIRDDSYTRRAVGVASTR